MTSRILFVFILLSFSTSPLLADHWANSVVDHYNLGQGTPENVLGPPYLGDVRQPWTDYAVRINVGGYLILDMGIGEEIPNLNGNDFYVKEVGAEDKLGSIDPYKIYVSNDLITWHYLGEGLGDTKFDLDGIVQQARYVKIVAGDRDSEIDGVEILDEVFLPTGWLKGNTHTHSNLSDGNSPPDLVAAHYYSLDYDFLVLTDHNLVSDFSQYSTPDFLCINGEEVTNLEEPVHHTNGIGLTYSIDPSTSLQETVNKILDQGGIPHVNHLSGSGLIASDILQIGGLCYMEVYNALEDYYDENLWDNILSHRKVMYGLAADDCHDLYNQSGRAWIVVRSDIISLESILTAISSGDFYSSNGVILNDYYFDSEQIIIDSQNGDFIEFIGQNGQILQFIENSYGTYNFTGSEIYVRARITNKQGEYAWTQPVFLPAFYLDPYADDVTRHNGISMGSPINTLGPPYEGKVPFYWQYEARIETGGYLVLDMGEGEEVTDREGPDLFVEEVDTEDDIGQPDPYHVYASMDASNWSYLGEGFGDWYFDLSGILSSARYIKIEVTQDDAEIDGVEANFFDPYADWVIDYESMTGSPRYVLGSPVLGPLGSIYQNCHVQIDTGGFLVLDLGPDEEVVDGTGTDLYLEEVDSEDEVGTDDPYIVYGSIDNVHWSEIGNGVGDEYFDLNGSLAWVRYLKLVPVNTDIEIDGVLGINLGYESPVKITLIPDQDPIIIPSSGGNFGYDIRIENTSSHSHTFNVWIMVFLPGGQNYGPVLGPRQLILAPGQVVSRHLTQYVSANVPQGNYLYQGFIGSYPYPIKDVDAFGFEKE